MNYNNYCVIMAGGIGSRFWPMSKTQRPKQFLDILGTGKSLLQQTFDRFAKVCPAENIYIVTNESHVAQVAEQLPLLSEKQILAEPQRRNTAPCIAFANFVIGKQNPNANIIVAPSDHLIQDEAKFTEVMLQSLDFTAKHNGLLTLGMTPSRPETGYGYIQVSENAVTDFDSISKVKTFTEKPDRATAEVFLKSGEFVWNAGIFIWSLSTINQAFESFLPEMLNYFTPKSELNSVIDEKRFIEHAFASCKSISIDNGIMEYADNVYVLSTDFGWSDLGTWDSLYELMPKDEQGNALKGNNILSFENKNTLFNVPDDKLVVAQGLDEFLVVESDGVLLICKKNDERKIREFVEEVKKRKGERYV